MCIRDRLYAIDAEKGGTPLWLFATGGPSVQSPVVAGDEVFVAAGPMVISLALATGEVVWQYPVGDNVTTEPVILDDAAMRIVRLASPFAAFPPEMHQKFDILAFARTWTFTNSDSLATSADRD